MAAAGSGIGVDESTSDVNCSCWAGLADMPMYDVSKDECCDGGGVDGRFGMNWFGNSRELPTYLPNLSTDRRS